MKPNVSVILPSIRPDRLVNFYISLCMSSKNPFELIIVSPYPLPTELEQYKNIKYIRDFGNPTRAQNIALLMCESDVVTWQADDAIMLNDSVDFHVNMLREMGGGSMDVVVAKYREGQVGSPERQIDHDDTYFKVCGGPAASPFLPREWWLFNVAFMYREFIERLGGFNCKLEGTWTSQTDLAIRAQASGANVKMSGVPCMVCDHMPGTSGDHQPIYECQTFHDVPLLQSMYNNPNWLSNIPLEIDINNWKLEESVWTRRFK